MNSFIGQALIFVALASAGAAVVVGLTSGARQSIRGLVWTQRAVYVFALAMVLANLVMFRALVAHDFTVSYVAQVGSRSTPLIFTIVSLWSSLEGSILFWGAILGVFLAAFTYANRTKYFEYMAYALAAMLVVGAFFAFLLAGPANPFLHLDPAPVDGPGPNPLLQNHVLMIVHPPMLYLGFAGMTIPFGIAIAALLRGKIGEAWLAPLRLWTLIPWTFLSIGIVLGGWWAYEVLGWGGYWAWDPVENASLLPWLAATGYLHATVVQERRGVLKVWTLGLVLAAFLLTLLGTFMTRSGVFNSVHAFTQSPIGPVFLTFLGLILVVSMGLMAGRAHLLVDEGHIDSPVSREAAFLLNNLVFVVFAFTVLVGTIFPLITEAVRGAKVSVGEPYFDRMAVPLGLMLVVLMGVSPALPWGKPRLAKVARTLAVPAIVAVCCAALIVVAGVHRPLVVVTCALAAFAVVATLRELLQPVWMRVASGKEPALLAAWRGLMSNRRRLGGYLVHLAVLVIAVAIAASQSYKQTAESSLTVGQGLDLGPYRLTFARVDGIEEAHRFSVVATIAVTTKQKELEPLSPRLNFYPTQREPVGTPVVQTLGLNDLYVSLMSVEPDGSRISIKAFLIPLVSWIWWSLILLVLGALISLWPHRRPARTQIETLEEPAP